MLFHFDLFKQFSSSVEQYREIDLLRGSLRSHCVECEGKIEIIFPDKQILMSTIFDFETKKKKEKYFTISVGSESVRTHSKRINDDLVKLEKF